MEEESQAPPKGAAAEATAAAAAAASAAAAQRATPEEVERDAAAGVLPKMHRTQLCKYFMKAGNCAKGAICNFAHGPAELRQEGKDKQREEDGMASAEAAAADGAADATADTAAAGKASAAQRASPEEVERDVAAGVLPKTYRTRLCKYYMQAGNCAKGSICNYAHGPAEHRQEPEKDQKREEDVTASAEAATGTAADGAADATADAAAAAAKEAADAEKAAALAGKIVKQVEFYFSDENLPTDAFLMKEVRKTAEGWVKISIIASFKKIKNMKPKSLKVVVEALRTSDALEVDAKGQSVRRVAPLPEIDLLEVQERTVLAENLPKGASVADLEALFGEVGPVKMVRICQPGDTKATTQKIQNSLSHESVKLHALIEYATLEDAVAAVPRLTDDKNWRSGLRVRPLASHMVQGKARFKEKKDAADSMERPEAPASGDAPSTSNDAEVTPEDGLSDEFTGVGKGGRKKRRDYASWASAGAYRANLPQRGAGAETGEATEDGSVRAPDERPRRLVLNARSSPGTGGSAQGPGAGAEPKQPDGTRGFARGRGRDAAGGIPAPPPPPVAPGSIVDAGTGDGDNEQ